MLLNHVEYALKNNPVRAPCQRHVESRMLLELGGRADGARALEVGCGRGVGAGTILDVFGATTVDGFDLDPRMVALARQRMSRRSDRARFWVGDAACVSAADETYDAVFDFGIIHHLPDWRTGVAEMYRVLTPGGRLYAEEVLAPFIRGTWHVLTHPQVDRFDALQFVSALEAIGFVGIRRHALGRWFAWFVAERPRA